MSIYLEIIIKLILILIFGLQCDGYTPSAFAVHLSMEILFPYFVVFHDLQNQAKSPAVIQFGVITGSQYRLRKDARKINEYADLISWV